MGCWVAIRIMTLVFEFKAFFVDFLVSVDRSFSEALKSRFFKRLHRIEQRLFHHAAQDQDFIFELLHFVFKGFADHTHSHILTLDAC